MHLGLAVRVLVDDINDLLAACIEFIFDIKDMQFCNAVQCAAYCDSGCCTASTDENHLHSLEINALFLDSLPVAHTVGVVTLQISGYIAVFVTGVDYGVDRAAQLCSLIYLIQIFVNDGLVRHGDVGTQHLQRTDTLNRCFQGIVVYLERKLDNIVAILVIGKVVGGRRLCMTDRVSH